MTSTKPQSILKIRTTPDGECERVLSTFLVNRAIPRSPPESLTPSSCQSKTTNKQLTHRPDSKTLNATSQY